MIEISGDAKVNGVVAKNTKTGERRNIALDSIFVELGYIAKTDFIGNLFKANEASVAILFTGYNDHNNIGI